MKRLAPAIFGLSCALLSGFASATTVAELQQRARAVQSRMQSDAERLSEAQRTDVYQLLGQVIENLDHPSGANSGSECFNEAYRSLSQADAIELCSGGGTIDTAHCWQDAYRNLSSRQAIDLCKNRGTEATSGCWKEAYRSLSADQAIQLCSNRGTLDTAECYNQAYRSVLSQGQSIRLCRRAGNTSNFTCWQDAYRRMSADEAINLCSNEP